MSRTVRASSSDAKGCPLWTLGRTGRATNGKVHARAHGADSGLWNGGKRGSFELAMTAARKRTTQKKPDRYWSGRVTRESNARDLREGVFKLEDPRAIAQSLKRSAEQSQRRKAEPYRSALSMLTFYMNRAGKNLPQSRKRILQQAKKELRALFGKAPAKPPPSHR